MMSSRTRYSRERLTGISNTRHVTEAISKNGLHVNVSKAMLRSALFYGSNTQRLHLPLLSMLRSALPALVAPVV